MVPSQPLNVLFMPDYSRSNPYQRLLRRALRDRGVEVALSWGNGLFPVAKAVRENGRTDVVHLHWPDYYFVRDSWIRSFVCAVRLLAELVALRARGIGLVWTVHNIQSHAGRHKRLELAVTRLLARLMDVVVVHCQAAKGLVRNRLGRSVADRLVVLPHGTYAGYYPNRISRTEARRRLAIGPDCFVFLFIGWIKPYKGIRRLLDAFSQLEDARLRLLICGRPAGREIADIVLAHAAMDRRLQARLEYLADDEIQLYMNAAEVVVLPYTHILTSGAAALALSFDKPVVAPRLGCLADMLDPRVDVLYDPTDQQGLERALREATATRGIKRSDASRRAATPAWPWIGRHTAHLYGLVSRRTGPKPGGRAGRLELEGSA
jgi:beta-1,4-mannosyltransferase